jgi:hypothetical protein
LPDRNPKAKVAIVNGMLCYFPPLIVLQGMLKVFGNNVDKMKMEVRVEVENFFLVKHLKSFIS